MNIDLYSIIPLVAAIAYIPLFVILVTNHRWEKRHRLFAIYLITALVWSFCTFLLRSELFLEHKLLLFRINMCCFISVVVQFYYFLKFYLHHSGGNIMRLNYIYLATMTISAILGYWPEGVTFNQGIVIPSKGWWLILLIGPLFLILIALLYFLIRRLRISTDPAERNRIVYFLSGIGIVSILAFINIPLLLGDMFPTAQIGHLINAAILTYATLRYRILDTKFIARRGLVYGSMMGLFLVVYSTWFVVIHLVCRLELTFASNFLVAILTAFTAAAFWVKARVYFYEKVDEIFYGESYYHRQELSEFIRTKIRGVFSLKELGEGLLPPLVKVLDCQQAHILLPENVTNDLVIGFSEPPSKETLLLRIKKDGPIINWLKRENRYLTRENLTILPEFKGLWSDEIDEIKKLDIEIFFPLINYGNLVGILALSQKRTGKYSLEDTNLVEGIASQVAISIEKEYLQEELKKREHELSLINRLAVLITSSLNIQDIYEAFVSGLRTMIEVDFATVALIAGQELHFSALSSEVGSAWKVGDRISLSNTATEWVVQHRKSLMEPDLERDSMFTTDTEFRKRGIRSIVYLPLISKDEGIGSLIIGSLIPNAYTATQVNLLERLASQISTSVANSRLYAKAEQRARIDELTGLYNRRHFDEILKHEVNRQSRYGSMFSLTFIDLDHFKRYNDTLGHLAGDKLLTYIGQKIQGATRNIDFAFRYGGDEFAIIMPNTSAENSHNVSERIRTSIASGNTSNQISVTASLGIASWPNDGLTADHIINAADRALYHAKKTGGNRTCMVSQILFSSADIEQENPAAEKETLNTIYALASTIEARDPYTYGHSQKVRTYAVALAEALGLSPEKVVSISHAALLHDIGKIGIYDEILNKPSRLDLKEFELVKTHPQLSRTIVAHVSSLTPCLQAIVQHHERWDGKGYPNGLKGESISLEGRILAIADSFDAMTSKRPYRDSLSYKEAIKELKRCSGTQFDPNLVGIFIPIALSIAPEELMVSPETSKTVT